MNEWWRYISKSAAGEELPDCTVQYIYIEQGRQMGLGMRMDRYYIEQRR
jgi:hypothetical protein